MTSDTFAAAAPRTVPLASLPTEDDGREIEVVDGWVELKEVALEGRTIVAPEAEVIEFTNCALRSCRIITSPETEVRVRQTSFASCDLSQVLFKTVQVARFQACKMTGIQIVGELSDTELIDSQLQMASLVMSTIGRVSFANCELIDVDLMESKLADVSFAGSRLAEVSMHHATFERVDLRDAKIESLSNVSSLAGCVIANHQLFELAPLLANIVGLSVEDLSGD